MSAVKRLTSLATRADKIQTELNRAVDMLGIVHDALWAYEPSLNPRLEKIAGAVEGVNILLQRIAKSLNPIVLCDERKPRRTRLSTDSRRLLQ